jgi:hypothetical protein
MKRINAYVPTIRDHSNPSAKPNTVRVRFDRGEFVRPELVVCHVIKRLGPEGDLLVEHNGKQLRVTRTLIDSVYRPARSNP